MDADCSVLYFRDSRAIVENTVYSTPLPLKVLERPNFTIADAHSCTMNSVCIVSHNVHVHMLCHKTNRKEELQLIPLQHLKGCR